jgi:hypothetical protein
MKYAWIFLFIIFSCKKESMISKQDFTSYVLKKVEEISTVAPTKCPLLPSDPNEFCYGLSLSLFDFAQKLRLAMYDEYRDPPFWQPPMGAYIGRERADYITLKRDDQKYFSITYTPITKEHVRDEQEIGRDMSEVKKHKAYIRIYFVDPTK